MPTYEYACTKCGERLEVVQSFSDAPLTVCPACRGKLRKVFSPVGVVFKGSGFYKTDSREKKKAAAASASTDSSGSKDSTSAADSNGSGASSGSTSGSDSSSSGSSSTTTSASASGPPGSSGKGPAGGSTGGGSKVA